MNTEKNKRKVLIVSLLVFLVSGGGVFTFFTFQGLEDLKDKPSFAFEYDSFPKKAFLPFLKYMGLVDTEVVSSLGKSSEAQSEYDPSKDPDFNPDAFSSGDVAVAGSKGAASGHRGASGRAYSPSGKLGANMSGPGAASSGGTKTGFTSSAFFSGSGFKDARTGKTVDASKMNADSKNLLARLEGTRSLLQTGLKSGSALTAKSKWDQGFAGSGSGHTSGMIYSGGATKLDKYDVKPEDLKLGDDKGLTAPEPGEPQEDKAAEASDPLMQKAKEAAASMAQDIASGMSNLTAGGITGGGGGGVQPQSTGGGSDPFLNSDVMSSVRNMTVPSDGSVTLYYSQSTGKYTAVYQGTDYMGPYVDSFEINSNGQVKF